MVAAAPTNSSNVAEYLGVTAILDYCLARGLEREAVYIWGDSKLCIMTLWGIWKIKGVDNPLQPGERMGLYAPVALEARHKLARFRNCRGSWIPRDENVIADGLSKSKLREAGVTFAIQPE
jgi:ribonuclease HI